MLDKNGQYFKNVREVLGLTQKEVAVKLGITAPTLVGFEQATVLKESTVQKLETVLDLHKDQNLEVIFDYLSVSFTFSNAEYIIENVLGLNQAMLPDDSRSWYTYTKNTFSSVTGSIFVGEVKRGDGTFLNLSGQGMREMEGYLTQQNRSWVDVFEKIIKNGGNVTRIDVAINDYLPMVDLVVLADKTRDGEYWSRIRTANVMGGLFKEVDGLRQQVSGVSIYFGARGSNFMINLYQKDWEQVENKAAEASTLEETPIKNRYELRMRQEFANKFLRIWSNLVQLMPIGEEISAIADLAFRYLNDHLVFLTDGIKNKRDGEVYGPWQILTGDYEPVHVKMDSKEMDIEKTIKAMLRVWAPKFSVVKTIDDTLGTHWLADILEEASTRRSKKDEAILRRAILDPKKYFSANRDKY